MNRLKIGIVTDQLLAGGVQLAAIEQVRELNKLGHKAKLIILMRKKYPTDFSYLVKNIPYQYLSDSYPLLFRKTIKFPIFNFLSTLHLMSPLLAPRVIKKSDYDILVSLGTTTCLTTQAIYRKNKLPYIAVIHDPIEYILEKAYQKTLLKFFFPLLRPVARYFERSFVRDAKKTVIISKVHYNYLNKNYGITPIIHTFGSATLKSLPLKRGDKLLSFGRWQNEKNPFFLLNLLNKLPNMHLTIAGSWIDKKEFNAFQAKVKEKKLQKRILLIPSYDEKKLFTLCKESRLFLHPHFEAFGLAALEAAGHGLPIIIPRKSGVTEVFQHGVHGFFPTKVDISEYSGFIKKLMKDERLAYTMGENAWRTVREKLSWEANAKQLLNLIYEMIPDKSKIFVLEISHTLGAPLAGGDKLMEPMAIRLSDKYKFSIIVSGVGANHWQNAPLKKELIILKPNPFDEIAKPVQVFLAYCIRMWQTYKILKKKVSAALDTPNALDALTPILYSSTNILPDVLPAYFIKRKFPRIRWISRIHHLIPPPHKREGKLLVNIVSSAMQALSLYMMRSEANLTLALNVNLKTDLQKRGFRKEKLKVLGGGIEFEKINKINPHEITKYHAIFLGRLHVTKGVFDTVPIWKEVSKKLPHAKLAIIGDGSEELKKELQKKIKNEHLSKNINVLGFLSYEKVYRIMKQADIFLFLDHEAGWGLAVAEAMACGLPVVGYNNGVLGSVYKNGYLVVPLGDHLSFSQQIINLLKNKSFRQKLAREARKEAARNDWNVTSKKFSNLLKKDI